jgi:hypothetical protein
LARDAGHQLVIARGQRQIVVARDLARRCFAGRPRGEQLSDLAMSQRAVARPHAIVDHRLIQGVREAIRVR